VLHVGRWDGEWVVRQPRVRVRDPGLVGCATATWLGARARAGRRDGRRFGASGGWMEEECEALRSVNSACKGAIAPQLESPIRRGWSWQHECLHNVLCFNKLRTQKPFRIVGQLQTCRTAYGLQHVRVASIPWHEDHAEQSYSHVPFSMALQTSSKQIAPKAYRCPYLRRSDRCIPTTCC
jgi:hypothetical protein